MTVELTQLRLKWRTILPQSQACDAPLYKYKTKPTQLMNEQSELH